MDTDVRDSMKLGRRVGSAVLADKDEQVRGTGRREVVGAVNQVNQFCAVGGRQHVVGG